MFSAIKDKDKKFSTPTYQRFDACFVRGEGARLYDETGREYIDFAAGIGVNSVGYGYAPWVDAVSGQAAALAHVSNLYYTKPAADLAEALAAAFPGDASVFLCNSGAEANEGAIKVARKYSYDRYNTKARGTIVTLENSFHGRTNAALAATGQAAFHDFFHPFPGGFKHVPAGDIDALEGALTEDVCAVLLECVQGEGGVLPLAPAYVQAAARLARQKDILLMIDEVQTGIGRTGSLFCFTQFGVTPDVVTLAKGLGGGLPIGAVLSAGKCREVLQSGQHGSTFGANPVVCAGALAVLELVNRPAFLAEVQRKGQYIRDFLAARQHLGITAVRGMGLMLGIDAEGVTARSAVERLLANGLVVLTAKTSLRFLPPLTITDEELARGLAIFEKTILQMRQEKGSV